MTEVVVDASVAAKWFRDESGWIEAAAILRRHQLGELSLVAPSLLGLELVNAAARRWLLPIEAISGLVRELSRLRIRVVEPELAHIVGWAAAGLTAYDASYVALAEQRECQLITADAEILARAPGIARPL